MISSFFCYATQKYKEPKKSVLKTLRKGIVFLFKMSKSAMFFLNRLLSEHIFRVQKFFVLGSFDVYRENQG